MEENTRDFQYLHFFSEQFVKLGIIVFNERLNYLSTNISACAKVLSFMGVINMEDISGRYQVISEYRGTVHCQALVLLALHRYIISGILFIDTEYD